MNVNTRIKKMRKSRGFTLVELLIVIIIIGILAGGMLLVAGGGTDKANATKIVSDLRTLKSAALMYYADNNGWPKHVDDYSSYIDREISSDSFVVFTTSGDWIGYKGTLLDEGDVKGKLAAVAEDSGLYAGDDSKPTIPKTKYAGGDGGVWMIIR
ncbi:MULTISPECIES: type II secretion system protein [Dethiosulfovibrio]|uniref:Prepilin-type N-terminal cleavage/methylation domain-containing protein n=2 Tax=Dethiosulfovibrio TaxID=47054 RepID=A0ABS9ELH7_9BACT|nr:MULTISPECIES: prepilin-type N-terminal cleavage/methylation domain-containing protein [Dethiosulfovibrio]MCF4113535.1 prepilin-type N-terminal cleavage/methylation domain-containing protein [Dethiosulfovibrio russensis]MCF4142005.1 prepilin-type N-terminal cleavage/methylation domain-containing protein [Dethiosulfovibrio marinus]MCF4144160.1 prepilin-type N-terminal cleavage/methylation domain-containing protein [Dethiosulfovibrio acidaminovorans]